MKCLDKIGIAVCSLLVVFAMAVAASAGHDVVVQQVRAPRQRVVVQRVVVPRQRVVVQQFAVPHVQQFVAPQAFYAPQQFNAGCAPVQQFRQQFNGGCSSLYGN